MLIAHERASTAANHALLDTEHTRMAAIDVVDKLAEIFGITWPYTAEVRGPSFLSSQCSPLHLLLICELYCALLADESRPFQVHEAHQRA